MKNLLYLFCFLLPVFGYGQSKQNLSELLWSRVNTCYSIYEEMGEYDHADMEKMDDTENGYLYISVSWAPCGCSCSSCVGAYKTASGEYTILQSDTEACSWKRKISSNRDFTEILPEGFGINSFISEPITEKMKQPVFFLDFEIPRQGTDTKLKLELVPFGLKAKGDDLLCYEYKEEESFRNCTSISRIKDIVEDIKDIKSLGFLLLGKFDMISEYDNSIISEAIGTDDSRFKTKVELQKSLIELWQIYQIYQNLEATVILLAWDKQNARFFIKEKSGKPEKIYFKDFLINNTYWSPTC